MSLMKWINDNTKIMYHLTDEILSYEDVKVGVSQEGKICVRKSRFTYECAPDCSSVKFNCVQRSTVDAIRSEAAAIASKGVRCRIVEPNQVYPLYLVHLTCRS